MSYGELRLKRFQDEDVVNPCSGRYEGGDKNLDVELIVDIDKTSKYSTSLGVLSGTVVIKGPTTKPWSVDAKALYFKVIPLTLKVTGRGLNTREVEANIKVAFNNDQKVGGRLSARMSFDTSSGTWRADMEINIFGKDGLIEKIVAKSMEKKSMFFKEVKLDIDFTEKLTWPTVVMRDLRTQPAGMEDRIMDPFSAFEDAGLKLLFDHDNSEKLADPTPHTPWTKADLYEAMMDYFDESKVTDENIWCMMGTLPPDKRYMGFSFDRKGKRGFGLFTGHTAFKGLEANCKKKKAEAQRCLLHYLVHECGHCLGLKHPFEIGAPESLSWMNYAHRYDVGREPGSFYQTFKYKFSDQELMILRHAPGKFFRAVSSHSLLSWLMGEGYIPKSEVPDMRLADDDDDNDVESGYDQAESKSEKPKPKRKIGLDLKMQGKYSRGQLLTFEARVKNEGRLPALIEGDLSVDSGNIQLYLTKPDGKTEVIEPFVRPIHSGYTKPRVLYTSEDDEGSDRYSELVTVGEGSDGYQIAAPGTYEVRAVYSGGRYKASSKTYTIEVANDDEDDDDDDDETREEIRTAATLQASSSPRFKKILAFWQKLESKPVEKKKSKVATLISVMEGLANDNARQAESGRKSRRGQRTISYATAKPAVNKKKLLQGTWDIVKYYHGQGTKADNMDYSNLVMARGKMYVAEKDTQQADAEFNQMMTDLMNRGTKYEVLTKLSRKWNNIKNPPVVADKYTSQNLQKRVNSVLTWAPTAYGDGEPDLSGIGLGKPFSNFDSDHIRKAEKVVEMLFTKYDETKDLVATVCYADMLQKGREVNYMALRWALEAFIVHSNDAKEAGIKYPEPDDRDESLTQDAAMMVTKREGEPSEDWMNYWRCDADFNYHHRHWHIAYALRRFLRRKQDGLESGEMPDHFERQGELFGYMHSQLLARYDADRESWGLPPVQPWEFEQTSMAFNAGLEFHSDRQWGRYAPRPAQKWPASAISEFKLWEGAYQKALDTRRVAPNIELTPDWSGHILESSSDTYDNVYGNYHNTGHGVFGSTGMPEWSTSYMNDTATAVRDPIFYRWHKRIDNLWQKNNDYYRSELAYDAPPVTITANDIILSMEDKPPADFGKMSYGKWTSKAPSEVACLKTGLGPARKKYEWDNKLCHEKFYYHLRMKRNDGTPKDKDMKLTLRVFICPKNRQQERRRWIEMDKFVCQIPAGSDHTLVTRADVHSSVIKRLHENVNQDEAKLVKVTKGFCECGWPYDMLLPRGEKDGEDYVLCVIATDNAIDSIGISTSCGSMSYCGARAEKYPDTRNMGYPFCSPITYQGQELPIPSVFDGLTNAAYKDFKIENNVAQPPPMKAVDCWWPYLQLGVNDGTLRREPKGGITEYIRSDLTGIFRVLIDTDMAVPSGGGKLLIRFQGRGSGGGHYVMKNVKLSLRKEQTIDIVKEETVIVQVQGQKKFIVPEMGIVSDPVELDFDPAKGDYFLTFTLDSPGVYLPASQETQTSTYHIPQNFAWAGFGENSWMRHVMGRFAYIQCVAGIMKEHPN